jgi:glutathione S-transferase
MHQIANMSDANGGRAQLQGRINDVDLCCGDTFTVADLWVLEITPFTEGVAAGALLPV